jgi:hypothetical protein
MAKRDMGTRTHDQFRDAGSATSCSSSLMREGRVLSRRRPSRPSSAKRSCQRQTQRLDQRRNNHTVARASDSILMGLIFDDRGNRMTPTYAVKKGARYRYYVSSALRGGPVGAANAQGAPTTTMRPLPGRED